MRPEMRVFGEPLAVGCAICAVRSATAQQSGHPDAERHDIGRVETRIENDDQALGVVTRLTRSPGIEAERDGVCSFRAATDLCGGVARRNLDCSVNLGRGLPPIALTELT